MENNHPGSTNKPTLLQRLNKTTQSLRIEVFALYLASRDPRTPWYAKALVLGVIAYAFSPIDLVPDFIPLLGYLDDLVLIPMGIWLARRMVPDEVMIDARQQAASRLVEDKSLGQWGTIIIIFIWVVVLGSLSSLVWYLIKR